MPRPIGKLALLVIDMQVHFSSMTDAGMVCEIRRTADWFRERGVPVVYTQHGHVDPEAEETSDVLVAWWGAEGSIKRGSASWQLVEDLGTQPADHILTSKRTYDAFQGTELQGLLDERGVDAVLVCGVMTNLCCETTARSAFVKNYNVLFLSDGCRTDSRKLHDASLRAVARGFGTVLTCEEARARFSSHRQ